jgi:nicotinamide-nucleotide amidase
MRVELINTGSELLLGRTTNTLAGHIGAELFKVGLRLARQVAVPDGEAIREALADAVARAEIVLVTGGLGPTTDDITREVAAEFAGVPLELDAGVLADIEERFRVRGYTMRERNRRQAMVPRGARVLRNANGTAPGLYFPAGDWPSGKSPHLFLLPGPPRELEPMFARDVLPLLGSWIPESERQVGLSLRLGGLGESEVEARVGERLLAIDGLELGYCARPGEVEVRLIGLPPVVAVAGDLVRREFAGQMVSEDDRPLERVVVEAMSAAGQTLAIAESCTGGAIADRITDVPGASAVLIAGWVTYANRAKAELLGIDPGLIEREGAVSEAVARAMAERAREVAGTDFGLATTGIAGPGGGSEAKPVGTVFVACSGPAGTRVERLFLPSDRLTFKRRVSQEALLRLLAAVRAE